MSEALAIRDEQRRAELEAVVERGLASFVEVGAALLEIRDARLYRDTHGTFEDYCRERWQFGRAQAYRLIQCGEVAAVLSPTGDIPRNEAQARELAPLLADEHALVETWRELREEHPEAITAIDVRRVVKNRLARIDRETEAEHRAVAAVPLPVPDGIDIRHSDLAALELEPQSVDLIFTDPPYPAEFLPEWEKLGRFATSFLKPGRLLVAYTGQYHLPEVMYALNLELEYVWLGALVTPGAHNQVQRKHIRSAAKPLLFYSNGAYEPGPWFEDSYVSEERVKTDHAWQQSVGAARYFIERLTEPGALVVDPFLGSGTTAVACQSLGRRFVGCDVDAAAVGATKLRLAA